ncbi:hypothetical protein CC78DRAFT_465258 [Lojkania enalia]|uniref:Uncharacterized protein n=1 Tax=Lojkania enalia TaxID=147567 RepID=A0A9P4N840_9PLEO|nr:hypothetical protein CC78DRAFT_465258 [Didymosphaeria enalia]
MILQLAAAIPIRRSEPFPSIDSGSDAWADALSGVGPLVLLIGERNTKQLLREISGLVDIFSMSFAPIGLLSVLTSMIRLCGSYTLRSYLGYEHEPRTNAALEMTRVNCGGVYADIVDGFITRSAASDPPSQALAVALLQGDTPNTVGESLKQIISCHQFQHLKATKLCSKNAGGVNWCFRLVAPLSASGDFWGIAGCIAVAIQFPDTKRILEDSLALPYELSESDANQFSSTLKDLPKHLKVTFMCTFDGVSELNTGRSTPIYWSLATAIGSLLAMIAIQTICLWREKWYSAGSMMMIAGYFCLASSVSMAAYMIHSSCDVATMKVRPKTSGAKWTQGLVMNMKNNDSLDTSGSCLMQARDQDYRFEAVWLKESALIRPVFSWLVSTLITLSFVCYYLGLRSVGWWASIAQLAVCLLAAFLRSLSKVERKKFEITDGIRLDKRCYSTGVLDMQRAMRMKKDQRVADNVDLRVYSLQTSSCIPLTGEFVAWRAAKLANTSIFRETGNALLSLTGMSLRVIQSHSINERKIIVSFNGGVLTEEGLAYPNAKLCLAFPTLIQDLAAPTPLLARAIMRQSQWAIENERICKKNLPFLGGMYVTTLDSLLTWWTIAEDRNDMRDQHKNLHGSFLIICTAFFLALLQNHGDDEALIKGIESAHASSSEEDEGYSKTFLNFVNSNLE